MIRTFALLFFAISSAFGLWESGLEVRFDSDPSGFGVTSFIDMPQTIADALADSARTWEQVKGPNVAGYEALELWCPVDDYTLCMLYDDNGNIGGMQIAFNPDKFSGSIFDWSVSGFARWCVTVDGTTVNYYFTRQYYVSPEYLATDAAIRCAERNSDVILQEGFLWVTGFNGVLYSIPADLTNFKEESVYTKQACISAMGTHYYYNMTVSLECVAEQVFPWFILELSNQLIGVGFMLPGKYTIDTGNLNPFEIPSKAAITMIVPTGPTCLYDFGDSPGVITMHTYFIKDGYRIVCP